ncbi:hypothetical protein E3T55_09785 [Cryobacterium frigoriphilum]|uniref:Uncharacterized protein n=1 Tax=Cryobacterium frigoriphilum TaxID=1259150 RepID=A0A4V3IR98_9MICO|nr:hypothetical protein [Cryobacterium frigoriphilum]TFD50188.1 hypothetical protein E3T55_09785 [Cryobacterium frigoriphilum]
MTFERTQALWDLLQTDAPQLAAVRASYHGPPSGTGDVLDALWWRLHPLTRTPAGLLDPAADLPALQARVYARPVAQPLAEPLAEPFSAGLDPATGRTRHATAAQHELWQLEQRLAGDAAALDAILERMSRAASATSLSTSLSGSGAANGAATDTLTDTVTVAPSGAGPAASAVVSTQAPVNMVGRFARRRRGLAVFVLGAVVGAVCAGLAATLMPEFAEPSAAGRGSSSATNDSATATALRIFSDPESWPDDTPPALGAEYDALTIRSVPGAVLPSHDYGVYVAHRVGGDVCIIVQQNHRSVETACTMPAVLADRGLGVRATVAADTPDAVFVTVAWQPDGSIVAEASSATEANVVPYELPQTDAPRNEFRT